MASQAWLVLGLGNPGDGYELTRHNIGFLAADQLAQRMQGRFTLHKPTARQSKSLLFEAQLRLSHPSEAIRLVVAKPQTYMNNSGQTAAALSHYYTIPTDRVIVIHDELDLPWGNFRVKIGGGDNGHNGLRSIRASLKSGEFYRIRVGIGRPTGRIEPIDYVLAKMSKAERNAMPSLLVDVADAVESLILNGLERTQSAFNS